MSVLTISVCIFWEKEIVKKAAHKMLVKLTPRVNFTSILIAAFVPIFFCQKITEQKSKYRKTVHLHFGTKMLLIQC